MKMKNIIYIIFLSFLMFDSACQDEDFIPKNELKVLCLDYIENEKLPKPTKDYQLRIELMKDPNTPGGDLLAEYLFYDTVKSSTPVIFTPENGLLFGRYVISVKKDKRSNVVEIVYKGGSIQLDMILK